MKIKDNYRNWIATLSPALGEREATAVTREAFTQLASLTPVDVALKGDEELSATTSAILDAALKRIATGEPVQYVTGAAWFNGLRIKVTPAVLIPRPETSQLVDFIVKEQGNRSDLRVIDLCTGSGAIALALSRRLPFADVTAVEISGDALEIARENGNALNCKINWVCADVLDATHLPSGTFDIIVSNPPYIPESEKSEIDANVWNYEPHRALLVPDSRPTLFYDAIIDWARQHLAANGALYFEINPHFVMDIVEALKGAGLNDVRVEKDSFGKNRFIIAHQ